MLIRLEHNGRIIHEIPSAAITGEIVIGRSHACTWQVPKEDSVSSSQHAALFLKGKAVWLKDLESTNGTFHNGKRILKKKLALRDKIGIGNCVLCVEPDRGADGKSASELIIRSGKGRGQKKTLKPPVFTIGSDPASDLAFLDMLVSRKHAEVLVKEDGSCWIRDLGSKNGTSVNDVPLRDDKERLLKDGDRIAFSHLEVEFHDGAFKRSNKQAWLRIGILVATIMLGLGLYRVYQSLRPSAESFIRSARRLAAQEQFAVAAEEVDKAANARHAVSNQVTIEDLRRLLGLWESTLKLWTRSKEALEKGKWTQVARDLGVLQATKKDAWEWNEQAAEEKENALRAKAMLDALLRAEASVRRDDVSFQTLDEDHDGVVKALAGLDGKTPPYLVLLKTELEKVEARQNVLLGESRRLEQALDQLQQDMPPYPEIVKVVEQACGSEEATLRRRAETMQAPLQALAKSFSLLSALAVRIREGEIRQALAEDLQLPGVDACAIDPRLSHARQVLERTHQNLKLKGNQLAVLLEDVDKRLAGASGTPESLQVLRDAAVMAKALACDSLDQPLPRRSRKESVGEYDRILGVEAFYEYLAALPEPMNPAMVADLAFVPMLMQAREMLKSLDALIAFMEQPDNQWLHAGKMAQTLARMNRIMAERDDLVGTFKAQAEAGAGRGALIAGGIAARLTTQSGKLTLKGEPAEAWLAAELKRQRSALQSLSGEYNLAAPSRQIEIRAKILAEGLPGDPIVRNMWAKRDAASGR